MEIRLRAWRFTTLLLAALGMAMGAAHVLELVPKMAYDAPTYAPPAFRVSLGCCRHGGTGPVDGIVVRAGAARERRVGARDPDRAQALPEAYARLRNRWEYGHLTAFAFWLAGFVALLRAALADARDDDAPVR